MSILWALLLFLLSISAVQCERNENFLEDMSYFQEDESVIQDDNMESDLQFYEGNEEELESTNMKMAEGMLDKDTCPMNDSQIQVAYQNGWRGSLRFTCRRGRALNHVGSIYSKKYKDRRWYFSCKRVSSSQYVHCRWQTRINKVGKSMNFVCPKHHYMAGLRSVYRRQKKDREWDALCCYSSSHCTKQCHRTGYHNYYNKPFKFSAPGSSIITGVFSHHRHFQKDRRWGATTCKVRQCRHKKTHSHKPQHKHTHRRKPRKFGWHFG